MTTESNNLLFWKKVKALANHAIDITNDKSNKTFDLLGNNHVELKESLMVLISTNESS